MWLSRIISLVLFLGTIFTGVFIIEDPKVREVFGEVCGAGFIGLICVWFGDEMGDWVGTTIRMQLITSPSPGSLVRFMGWVLLSIPYAALVIYKAM